jgi:hypothetical protein
MMPRNTAIKSAGDGHSEHCCARFTRPKHTDSHVAPGLQEAAANRFDEVLNTVSNHPA